MNENLRTILRCTAFAAVVIATLVLVPAAAEAQCQPGTHGVTIVKECTSPKNSCANDLGCSDGNACNGLEECVTEGAPGSNVVDCTITLSNPAIHCDDITVTEACDEMQGGTGSPPTSCDILVTSAPGGTGPGCDAGSNLGGAETCTLNPGESITFRSNFYTLQPADPDPLGDQATITVVDACTAGGASCSTTPNSVQFTAATDVVSGCTPGTPLVCNDGLFCTTDVCVPATGCATTPVVCGDDGLFCNGPESCDETANACVSGPAVVCPSDSNACNGPEFCDETANACASGPALVCDDGLFCTTDSCVPATGCTTTAATCESDGLFCNGPETCTETAEGCTSGPAVVCPTDNDACDGPEACDEPTDSCISTGPFVDCTGAFFCSTESCNPATGLCVAGAIDNNCDDRNACTTDACDEANNRCTNIDDVTRTCDENCAECDPTAGACVPLDPLPAGCVPGPEGRMTGGGTVFGTGKQRYTHGFTLHCDPEDGSNNLQINWAGNQFHLEELTSATCTDDPNLDQRPPGHSTFDTYIGVGIGRCNGVPGVPISFTFVDAGEPGTSDTMRIEITGCPGLGTVTISGPLKKGNHQAHAN